MGPATPACEGRKGEGNDLGRISASAIAPAEVGTRHRKSNQLAQPINCLGDRMGKHPRGLIVLEDGACSVDAPVS